VPSERRLIRAAGVVPAVLAGFEFRDLLALSGHVGAVASAAMRNSNLGCLIVLALVAAVLLRELGRGLPAQAPRPRWSAGFVGRWLLCSAAVLSCFACDGVWRGYAHVGHRVVVVQVLGAGGWNSVLAALFVGFLAAVSVRCARWMLRAVGIWRGAPPAALVGLPGGLIRVVSPVLARQAPVADGWSSRGPPLAAAVTFN